MSGFVGRTVVITGAARGLGRAFALAFAAEGANVVAADIDLAGAVETARLIGEADGIALGAHVDVTSPESTGAVITATVDAFGPIDVLVNNAAIYSSLTRTPFTEIDPAEWDRVMAVNVKGTWLMTVAATPVLSAEGARIINISSATVLSGSPLWMHYVASKAAVIGMTRVLARELGERGTTVNTIAPGFTLTEASLALMDDASTYGVDRGAIKRACLPDDIVGTALFLASESAGYITGQTLVVDGGKQFL
ncbi:SDR family NAD(P)-dependent oxidoreductase [Marisediminicola antarctica]|uniref:Dehydrogenase n=1 Tax=Marisediminicola antarctica TaxID=674079 RepID=A0A7L5AE58_9MICO|nr:SDR family oxidoreductase [Marisediminicola antarctica]QHO68540.1 dehydrogenase [Marisediminicola antarctica]